MEEMHFQLKPQSHSFQLQLWKLCSIVFIIMTIATKRLQAHQGCVFHDGLSAESDGVRFIRLREDAPVGKEILSFKAYPKSKIALQSSENNGDHKYFSGHDLNATTVVVTLTRSLEDLVDRDVPRNLLKFRIVCLTHNEKLEEGSSLSVTVYIEDVNDNKPEFLNTPYTVDVLENMVPGTILFEGIQAFDRDKPNTPNSEIHFSMSTVPEQLSNDGSPYFALKSPHKPLLILRKELDFDNGIRVFKLPLFAWDRGTPANQVNTTITVNVKDVDDLPPKFTEGVYRTKINEFYPITGMPIRVALYFNPPVMAYDQDSLNATLIYDIISGNERKLFRVNSNNGVIYLQKEIDLEEESLPGNTFVLQIEARQKDNPLQKAVARIEVEIIDLNDNYPDFEADFYNISIVENLPSGFSVLQVNAIDRDQGENAEFLYNLKEQMKNAGAFLIDSRTGWIMVKNDHLLDREKRKSLQLEVEALERIPSYIDDKQLRKPGPTSVKVEITLLDTNDNTPKFEHGNLYEFKVPITSPIGYKIGQVMAFDPDEGPNGKLIYELQRPKKSGFIPFRLDAQNGTIYVSGPLRQGRIAIFVEASDQPINPSERRFSLAVVTVEVYATIDDQAIDFVGAPYEFWIGSDAVLGTSVGQVRTTLVYENDDEIMYDLLHTYSEGVPFAIEERSGIITIIRELSDFQRKLYHFEAVANYLFSNLSQSSFMPRSSSALTTVSAPDLTDEGVLITNVTIHVVSDDGSHLPFKPIIEEINMKVIKFHIAENVAGGVIGQLLHQNSLNMHNNGLEPFRTLKAPKPTDVNLDMVGTKFRSRNRKQRQTRKEKISRRLPGDPNIKLRYIIANQQDVINKITITEDGTLLTLVGLDREEKSKYDLTVIVEYTTGLVSGAGIYQVEITVDDVNDNAPEFSDHNYMGLIKENTFKGAQVALNKLIIINDRDVGSNGEFKVSLQGDYNDLFKIELVQQENATVLNTIALRPETFHVYNITEQWNEELKFLEMQSELKPMHLRINNQPFFRITYTGLRPLDREKDQIYHLKIMAIDSGGLHTYATLYVLISDVNDNAPVFERISVFKDSKIEIREYTTEMEIYFVESASLMLPPFSTSMTLPPYFLAGAPRSIDVFDGNGTNFLKIASRARNRVKSRNKRATASRAVHNCPLFAVFENISMNTKILQISASDEDYGRNAQVEYEISNELVQKALSGPNFSKLVGIKYFAIDKLSGELIVNYPLPANIDIWLNLTASDIDNLKDTTCLHFAVVDVNNHAPTFKKSSYSFDIEEGDYSDSVLGQVIAVDFDFDQNANITYSLRNNNLPFAIKPYSGVIRIIANLDRELKDKYNFQVIASDCAEPKLRMSSSVDVEVNILDINDNKPVFIGYDDMVKAELYINNIADRTLQVPLFKAFLDRNTKPGTFVKQINAIDKDYTGNGNGLVLYSLLPQENHPQPIFQIDFRDGTLVTVSNFRGFNDYEHLNVTVVASDLGSPALSSTAVVLINLQGHAISEPISIPEDQLDWQNRSLFRHQYYEIQIMENNEVPLEVMKLNYSFDINTELLRWSLWVEEGVDMQPNTHPPFEFDAKLSALYALKSFDREIIARYQLRLRGDKYSRKSRTFSRLKYPVNDERLEGVENNECRIVVKILDDNDNSPKFKGGGKPIIAVVPKTAVFGYPVTNVEATDADINLNAEIRYKLLNEPSRLFGIDEYTGKIRLIANIEPTDTRVHGFDVKATDRAGADDGHSSIANVFVYVIDERKQVRIVIAGKPVEVERKIDALVDALSNAIGMEIRVRLLEPHFGSLEPATDAYIYAVDYQTNSLVEMEQLQQSLAGLQLDVLQLKQQQLQQQQHPNGKWNASKIMPRIIALAEFGQLPRKPSHGTTFWTNLEIITVIMLSFCGVGGILIAMCFVCLKQRRGIWSQQEFPSSETGLTYAIARAGLDSCRRRHQHQQQQQHQHQQLTQQQQQHLHHHQQHQHQTQSQLSHQTAHKINAQHRHSQQSLSSVKTQSTALAAQKMEKEWALVPHQKPAITPTSLHTHHHLQHAALQSHQHQHQHHLHHHHHHNHQQLHQHQHQHQKHQQHQQQQQQQQEQQHQQQQQQQQQQPQDTQYVPQTQHQHQHHYQHLNGEKKPREYIDVPLPKSVTALRSNISPVEPDEKNSKFILKYNSCQPVNNLQNPQNYETSMFSLYSNGQDSGVDFLSSRELYETSPDSFDSQPSKLALQPLCPRHAKDNVTSKGKQSNFCNTDSSFNSSDNYEDSLQNEDALAATTNCRSLCERHLQQHKHRQMELYQASHFEKRSCVRHSFSGVKDDLMQNSPRINMRSRGNILRNSMNDLEQRLINLEQSFRRPTNFQKTNSIL